MIIVKTAIITIKVAKPWAFKVELGDEDLLGSETKKKKGELV